MRKIRVVRYKSKWSKLFAKEAEKICAILKNEIMLIEHIGSTSIPGLAAKPVIDILIGVKDINKIDNYNAELGKLSYQAKGEFGIENRRFFLKPSEKKRKFYIHIFEIDNPEVWRHINFKRYMIAHSNKVKLYGELKQRLARQFPYDIESYIDGKNEFIKEIDKKAKQWMLNKTLETKRLLLRPFNLQDAKTVQQLAGDQAISDGTYYIPYPYKEGIAEKWIIEHRVACEKGNQAVFAITVKETNDLVGAVGLMLDKKQLQAELGYWIGRPFWNKGYASEAAQAIIKYGFSELYLRCIYADCFSWNISSKKVLQKIGMVLQKSFDKYVERRHRFEQVDQYILTCDYSKAKL